MSTQPHSAIRPRRRQPEASRNAILNAALAEFAREGLAGARVDAIADAAGVNKALLYYYFADKESLYGAILDRFFETLVERITTVCSQPGTAGERFLSYARTHFDSVAESPYYAHIFMSELMSASRGGSPHLDRIFARYMQPIGALVLALVEEGVRTREFRRVDPNQFLPSAIGSIVHYFLTAPLRQKFVPGLDFTTPQAIQERRAAVLDFIAAALFTDRDAGIKLAARIAAQRPATAHRKKHESHGEAAELAPPSRFDTAKVMQATQPLKTRDRDGASSAREFDRRNTSPEGAAQLSPARRRNRSAGLRAPKTTSPVGTAHFSSKSAVPHGKGKHS